MKTAKRNTPRVSLSIRIIRLLFRAYPKTFRDVYGREMERTMVDILTEHRIAGGSVFRFWASVVADIGQTAMRERINEMRARELSLWVVAAAVGFTIACIDSSPGWDDTGITVGGLLLSSAAFAFLMPARPWAVALAIGVWIPSAGIWLRHDYTMLFTLVFPLVGAYAGAFVRNLAGGARAAP